jgi:hypothetical protein
MQIRNERIPDLILQANDTHLWFTFPNEIHDDSLLASYLDLMPPEEREK